MSNSENDTSKSTQFLLTVDSFLRGSFDKEQPLSLILTFQVNCPGCFHYALPLMNELYEKHSSNIQFFVLSTAFEDFELNTLENTVKLLETGQTVGETKKAGISSFTLNKAIAVGFDKVEVLSDEMIEERTREEFQKLLVAEPRLVAVPPEVVQQMVKAAVSQRANEPRTFTDNEMRGTPTFSLIGKNQTLLAQWIGHRPKEVVEQLIDETIKEIKKK